MNDHNYIINVDELITTFDNLYNDLSYQFPTHVKNKVIKNIVIVENYQTHWLLNVKDLKQYQIRMTLYQLI